jgi:putative phosphoribosyl transferase
MPGGGPPFADRREAGRALGAEVAARPLGPADVLVLGLPRGGAVVAAGVAAALGAPVDVLLVRKLGLPGQPELAMGAIAVAGHFVETVRNDALLAGVRVGEETFATVRARELAELRRRQVAYRGDRPPPRLAGRTVVLVDDGLATGSTMRAAVSAAAGQAPARLVVAVPVGSPRCCAQLRGSVDELVCATVPGGRCSLRHIAA